VEASERLGVQKHCNWQSLTAVYRLGVYLRQVARPAQNNPKIRSQVILENKKNLICFTSI
jgi:hypothetical protein